VRTLDPILVAPLLQEIMALAPKKVPSFESTAPLTGALRFPQSLILHDATVPDHFPFTPHLRFLDPQNL
jgi:hypothetical protein